MQYITISNGQTFLDLAMQHAGSAEAAFAMSLQSNVPITQELQAGNQLPAPAVVSDGIRNAFAVEKAKPLSIIITQGEDAMNEGIGYWVMEDDFVVS